MINSIINKLRIFNNSLNLFISDIIIGYYNTTIISITIICGVDITHMCPITKTLIILLIY